MVSIKMEQSEISRLFAEGERGEHAQDFPGKGIGLFVIQRALQLMNKQEMYIQPNFDRSEVYSGRTYVENHFHLYL